MTRVVYAGRTRLTVPCAWSEFLWRGRRYRLAGPLAAEPGRVTVEPPRPRYAPKEQP